MTNREMLILALKEDESDDAFDDGGVTTEAVIYYSISCPYRSSGDTTRAECEGDVEKICREVCSICKQNWLDNEVDE